ncbi:formylmethanofuran dehydrogenase subunit B [soil metagenome]
MTNLRTIADVACTVCGCVCDDLAVTVDGDTIMKVTNACSLAEPWFPAQAAARPPKAMINGIEVTFDDAIQKAAAILRDSKSPLIYGLSRSTTEGQRAATALADKLGATIDTTASTGHAPSIVALQQVGESTCTLGEVKNRADLVIFWNSDPVTTHPRHFERYSVDAVGRFTPNGRKDRYVVVVDTEETATAKQADLFIQIDAQNNWETLWQLRLLVAGHTLRSEDSASRLTELAARMKACKFGIVFFGATITKGAMAHRTVEALLQLVTDLNDHTRFYARRMRRYGDVAGADSVLTWQTGYPFGVNFAAGYPRYNPGEFTGPEMLARKEVDACLLIGSDAVADFPAEAIAQLKSIPVIRFDSPATVCDLPTAVTFTTAVYGIHRPGTAYRMDEVPIPLKVLVPTEYPSDAEVIEAISVAISSSLSPAW